MVPPLQFQKKIQSDLKVRSIRHDPPFAVPKYFWSHLSTQYNLEMVRLLKFQNIYPQNDKLSAH